MSLLKRMFTLEEFRIPSFYRDLFIEMLISLFLVMFITFSLTTMNTSHYQPNTLHIGLMVGLVIFLLIEGYHHFSGAHMNPVVSFGFFIDGRITFVRAFLYTIMQCIGGTLGSCIVYGLSPPDVRENFAPFAPASSIGTGAGLVVELVFTFSLIFTAVSTHDKTTHIATLPSLPTALCVGTAIMAAGTWTGACLNPIVALGLSVITKNFSHHWIYWVGEYAGALAAVIVHKLYKMARTEPRNSTRENINTKAETEALRNDKSRQDIKSLVEKIIQLTAQYEYNVTKLDGLDLHNVSDI